MKLSCVFNSSIVPKKSIISILHPVSSKTSLLNASAVSSPSSIPPPGSLNSFFKDLLNTAIFLSSLSTIPLAPNLCLYFSTGLDFSPITQGVFTDKFPFCLAKDVVDIISVFNVDPKAPVFKIPFVSEEFTIDFTEFELWFYIMRFFILIGFIISLIVLTRGIIG